MMRQMRAEAWPSRQTEPRPAYPYVALERPSGEAGWPIAFPSIDPRADNGVRLVELHRNHVVLRRRMAGMAMRVELPLGHYEGVAVALLDPDGDSDGVAVVLVHADPELSVTLYSAPHIDDVVAEWRRWTAELGLPMLVTEEDGTRRPAHEMMGRLAVGPTGIRRRRRGALKHRRPTVFRRRAPGLAGNGLAVHRGERELIARD